MQGARAHTSRAVSGSLLQSSVLMSSVHDDAKPELIPLSLSSSSITVPEIQELGALESNKLSVTGGAGIRPQLSADAALLTKIPFTRGKRLPLRRTVTESAVWSSPPRQSLGREIQHAAAETWLITRLAFSLLAYLGLGYRWITKLLALGLYATFLMPGFVQIGYYYFFSKYVYRSITYGDKPRNRLDLYLPGERTEPKPVVVFITGGAWVIGYKAWGSLLGQQLVDRDIIVACIDYRNFPQGKMKDMVEDVSKGISFVVNNVEQFGGDPDRVYLAGQSAGAHLAAHTLVQQAKKESHSGSTALLWRASDFKAFIGISGGYNLCKLVNHFHKQGLYRSLFASMVDGEENLVKFSPDLEVQSPLYEEARKYLPHMALFHGDADYSIPSDASVCFAESLQSVGVPVTTRLYPGKTHTDLILQDPMRGGVDELLEDVLLVLGTDAVRADAPGRRRMVPEILLQLARLVSPF